jgi:hypothetical protein
MILTEEKFIAIENDEEKSDYVRQGWTYVVTCVGLRPHYILSSFIIYTLGKYREKEV